MFTRRVSKSLTGSVRLLEVKEDLEGPWSEQRIRTVLIPREYTRVDEIIDLVFSATEDVKQEQLASEEEEQEGATTQTKASPVGFHAACASRVGKHLGLDLVRRSRATFTTPDGNVTVLCKVSKEHGSEESGGYWFAFHPHQKERLESSTKAYVAFGCGSPAKIVLIPLEDFTPLLSGMNQTELENGRSYWHVHIRDDRGRVQLVRSKEATNPDISQNVIRSEESPR